MLKRICTETRAAYKKVSDYWWVGVSGMVLPERRYWRVSYRRRLYDERKDRFDMRW